MKPFTVHRGRVAPLDRVNVDTDQIIPKQFLKRIEKTGFGQFLFYDWRFSAEGTKNPDFILHEPRYEGATVMIAGKNFGCGSSREHAPLAIKTAGISCVIAKSFARIFFRNAINIGLPLLESAEAVDNIKNGDELEVDLSTGKIKNLTSGKTFSAKPYPEFMSELINAGGLVEYTKKRLAQRRS